MNFDWIGLLSGVALCAISFLVSPFWLALCTALLGVFVVGVFAGLLFSQTLAPPPGRRC